MNAKTKNNIEEIKEKVVPLLQNYGAVRAGIFGSVIRGEAKKNSDIDILVEFSKEVRMGLMEFAHIINEIEDKLNKKVDLIEYTSIHPLLKDNILKEEVEIL